MINHLQLRELVIQPALNGMELYSPSAEEMLICISAQESEDGYYLKQTVGGVYAALSIFQMQPETHDNIWNKTLSSVAHSYTGLLILKTCNYTLRPKASVMVYNLLYAACMTRAFWLSVEEPFVEVGDIDGFWDLYKRYWNTYEGKATKDEFMANYKRYVVS